MDMTFLSSPEMRIKKFEWCSLQWDESRIERAVSKIVETDRPRWITFDVLYGSFFKWLMICAFMRRLLFFVTTQFVVSSVWWPCFSQVFKHVLALLVQEFAISQFRESIHEIELAKEIRLDPIQVSHCIHCPLRLRNFLAVIFEIFFLLSLIFLLAWRIHLVFPAHLLLNVLQSVIFDWLRSDRLYVEIAVGNLNCGSLNELLLH